MRFCTKCGAQLDAEALFCGNCGAMAKQRTSETMQQKQQQTWGAAVRQQENSAQRIVRQAAVQQPNAVPQRNGAQQEIGRCALTIKRKRQYVACAGTVHVLVDGRDLGKVGIGGTVSTVVYADTARVEARCSFMGKETLRKWQVLQLDRSVSVTIEVEFAMSGSVGISMYLNTTGAVVLEEGY